ncbi:MAG: PEGA domain-containing protein [Muribaculaceae bacterium]|nr:PEGA domain-containing protein [Muribaculaceae bacterium]
MLQVFFHSGDNINLDFDHPTLGIARLQAPAGGYQAGHIYGTTILNSGTVSITINTEPAGAKLTFDGISQPGQTPITIKNVNMGEHTVSITPANPNIASGINEETIYVSPSRLSFNYDLYKKKDITIVTDPEDADLKIYYNNQLIADSFGKAVIKDAPYDRKYTIVAKKGTDEVTTDLFISDKTPDIYKVKVSGVRYVTFTAKRNNKEIANAEIRVDNKVIGLTPVTEAIDYGKHDVEALYYGRYVKKTLEVNKNTKDYDTYKSGFFSIGLSVLF